MNAGSVKGILPAVSAAVLAVGVVVFAMTWRAMPAGLKSIRQRTGDIMRLRAIEERLSREETRAKLLASGNAEGIATVEDVRKTLPEGAHGELKASAPETLAGGALEQRCEAAFRDTDLRTVMTWAQVLDRHPNWRLVSCTIRASRDAGGFGDVQFEWDVILPKGLSQTPSR